ncbi:hypothetical protein GQ568_03425 [Patescibacteria group bacterium]|nr:hypothetical protein [Patescibacteria group bacterium]
MRKLIFNANFSKDIARELRKDFKKLGTKFVAVRSSATAEDSSSASWAGELETYLNITEKDLIQSVKKCWSSLFTPRAIFYRFEKKLQNQKVSVAVVVQKMIQSDVSGICFTTHPVTEDHNQMVIEAGYGLGELIVGGEITPDCYIVDKKNNLILEIVVNLQEKVMMRKNKTNVIIEIKKRKGSCQKLTGKQIMKLAEICSKIEKHYKKPQDIEWAFEKGKFYITQSRPITTL